MSDSSKQDREGITGKTSGIEAPATTIVGGRPPGMGKGQVTIPRGIDVLVKKASVDPEFRVRLLEERAEAAREIQLELSRAEAAMLNTVPRDQIERIIEKTTVPDEHRRVFLGKIGAAMLAVLGFGLSGCFVTGIRPEFTGIRPDDPDSSRESPEELPEEPPEELPEGLKFLGDSSKALTITTEDEGEDSVVLSVAYDCPFRTGEITPFFLPNHVSQGASMTYKPKSSRASKGRGKTTFRVTGKGGRTDWLLVRLKSATAKCRQASGRIPRGFFDVKDLGEYMVDGCVIWRIQKLQKVWPARE